MQKTKEETIEVSKEILNEMVNDIENLLDNMEIIVKRQSMNKIKERLNDVKSNKIKCLSEEDFNNFMKKEGIDA